MIMEKSHILSANAVIITCLNSCAPLREDNHIDGRKGGVLALSEEDLEASCKISPFSFFHCLKSHC